ncbi:wall-associated receptor kinase 2-like isoform X2 [Prunus avium]|uniref:Wall-associated receptor kinase 2-like isoform X2 n=1 Tax=Prunus avium TaxID=42229 RepID=A0A6P5RKP8_PRUAV|nr:wall-associated receptor kinase 2-like isoform X2 [Prunus avium]
MMHMSFIFFSNIDECKAPNSGSTGVCVNSPGDYSCKCPIGYKNDGMNPKICIKDNRSKNILLLIISLGVSAGLLILLGAISWLYCCLQRRKFIKLKEKYFKESGGLLLEQHLASQGGSMETTRIFTAEALEKATNNYHESRVLGEGGYGTVYKGILPDNKVVAIKKSKIGASTQKEQFVNEMIVLSQINHRNVVRLWGCCLETPVPLLVYEFVTNGTLFEHIHNIRDKRSSLPWDLRMKIATETSGALAYLHSSTSMPIIHRDVKTTNILLDENYRAKVSLKMMRVLLVILIFLGAAITTAAAQALPQALPGCQDKCGNLTVPYPFGITDGCQKEGFPFFTCNTSTQPPNLLWDGDSIVSNFSLAEGEMQWQQYISQDCYDKQGFKTFNNNPWVELPSPFTVSNTKNKFIAVGCDTYAFFTGYRGDDQLITGCLTLCDTLDSVDQESCSGVGCCQTNIPIGLKNTTLTLDSYYNHTDVWSFNPCSYAFFVEEGHFSFSNKSFDELKNKDTLPVILNWAIGDEEDPCDEAQKRQDFVCKGNSTCVNPINRSGYICRCLQGYQGNPYHPDGCQDIDECKAAINPCNNGDCVNLHGNYTCLCHKGYKMDSINGTTTCVKYNPSSKNMTLKISLGVSTGLLILLGAISWLYCCLQRRKFIKLKEKYFKENGGLLLEQHLASQGIETTRIFTAEALEKATNNYHESKVLGEGGYGTVYKGILPDNKVVAIKKSKIGASTQKEQFVNEMIVLSQINHRNVVRLLGCCLETPTPLLVYEFVTNGTLFEHIHNIRDKRSSLPWDLRMKIATETSGALAYLHSSTSMPIIHRDVKTTNILLDENYTAKVSDFGASKLIPVDETQLTTLVQGTLGYLDPEYFLSNQLTDKSDVYSFGVVLAELLTSRVALCFDRPEAERNLASFFVCSVEEDRLTQILDDDIVNDENIETLKHVAILAKRCLRLQGEERPTMKEVALELEGMRIMAKHPWGKADCPEETEHLLGSRKSDAYRVDVTAADCGHPSGTSSGYDSMQIQTLMAYGDGR